MLTKDYPTEYFRLKDRISDVEKLLSNESFIRSGNFEQIEKKRTVLRNLTAQKESIVGFWKEGIVSYLGADWVTWLTQHHREQTLSAEIEPFSKEWFTKVYSSASPSDEEILKIYSQLSSQL